MLIEDLIIEIKYKKDSLKHINNYIIDEISENWSCRKGEFSDSYDKVMGLLHAHLSVVDSIENILNSYQNEVDDNYTELLETEIWNFI